MTHYEFEHLGNILREGIFEVPDYQRNYSWKEKPQLNDLWEDLENINLDSQAKHFTGMIVVEHVSDKTRFGKPYKIYKIIDGQQRITTLAILLFCVHEELKGINSNDAAKTAKNILTEYIKDDSTDIYRLKLNGSDDDYLKNVILRPQSEEMVGREAMTPSENRLKEAKSFFSEKIKGHDFDYLEKIVEKVCGKLIFIRYEVGSEVEAGLVFELMNDRGEPLTQIDKIKNYLIYIAYREDDPDLATYINASWGEIFKNVMDAGRFVEDNLLRYHWIIYSGELKESDIHRRLKSRYKLGTADLAVNIRDYVNSLREASYVFRELNNPNVSFCDMDVTLTNQIREYLHGLARLRNMATFMPILIAARITFGDYAQYFRDIVKACETYAFRVYKVSNKRADTGLSILSNRAHRIYIQRSSEEKERLCKNTLDDIVWHISYYDADDEEFKYNLNRRNFYHGLMEQYEVAYLLYEFEKKKCEGSKETACTWSDDKKPTIEHIWPDNPRQYDEWTDQHKEKHKMNKFKLGNLTLTFWNPELSNKDFRDKRRKYAESNLYIQRELANKRSWGTKQIRERTYEIIEFALERWGI